MSHWRESLRKNLESAYPIFGALTILNFLVFVGLTLHFGGDAVNGKIEADHYYLWGYNAHTGKKGYTEVSPAIFQYSTWHVYSIFITWPLMLAGGIALGNTRRRRGRRG
jgi:hypothetical protein